MSTASDGLPDETPSEPSDATDTTPKIKKARASSNSDVKLLKQRRKKLLAQKLLRVMQQREWTYSELGRRAGLNRDVISTIMNEKSYPSAPTLRALAHAIGVPPVELSESYVEAVPEPLKDTSAGLASVPGQPGRMHLYVNRIIRTQTALKIMELVEEDDALQRQNRS